MIEKFKTTKNTFLAFAILLLLLAPLPSMAQTGLDQLQSNLGTVGTKTGLGDQNDSDLKGRIVDIVNIALGFLGIIAVILIIYAGFKWMTAAGNEEAVSDAKSAIRNAAIGLAVVFLSFIIINFTITQLSKSTGEGDNNVLGPTSCLYDGGTGCRVVCVEVTGSVCPQSFAIPRSTRCDVGTIPLTQSIPGTCSQTCPEANGLGCLPL